MTCFFTVCNRKQLPEALALGESIRTHHPDARFAIGFADQLASLSLPKGVELIDIDRLKIPQLEEMSLRYHDFEFVHAVRPWFARFLLEEFSQSDSWVFLAPTTCVYHPLDEIIDLPSDFLLTPHITQGLPSSTSLDDKRILNMGMFHSNAWVARKTPDVMNLLQWWSERTIDRAFLDLCNGMCLDQLWLNYAPIHVKNWVIIRNSNWHIGLHNLLQNPIELNGQSPTLWQKNVLTIDFAGAQGFHPVWSDHLDVVTGNRVWATLFKTYHNRVKSYANPSWGEPSHYGRPTQVSSLRTFRKSVKSEIGHILQLIDKIDI